MPDTLSRSEFIARLARSMPSVLAPQVEDAVKTLLDSLAKSLATGRRIEIRGFGSFSLHALPPRLARNPKTGEKLTVGHKRRLHFKPGQDLKNRVNHALNVGRGSTPKQEGGRLGEADREHRARKHLNQSIG
jgi:integration host factor subunit beta